GRQGRPTEQSLTSEEVEVGSKGEGTTHVIYVEMPANGRFDITLTVVEAINDVSIIAAWEDSPLPPIDEPEENDDNEAIEGSCEDMAQELFSTIDANDDGVIDQREFDNDAEAVEVNFNDVDLNGDGEVEYREVLQEVCSCTNEIAVLTGKMSSTGQGVSLEAFAELDLKNEYDAPAIDLNDNQYVSQEELEILAIVCTTTFDAFDGDGDGVNDDEDAFPENPDESKDTDGDGVGDNADLAPSVANDLIYGSVGLVGAIVFFVLVLLGMGSFRGDDDEQGPNDWDELKQNDLASQMLGLNDPDSIAEPSDAPMNATEDIYAEANKSDSLTESFAPAPHQHDAFSVPSMDAFSDLLQTTGATPPSQQLMGMLDASGSEVLEFPASSGIMWTRSSPSEAWHQR
ncbi:MAG: hypothetical protein OSA38_04620, partial [Candidatus Poseidoniaceae archaeon]|nr:hypothetical protein [Candidatus Poseidoniaceae archaeon]